MGLQPGPGLSLSGLAVKTPTPNPAPRGGEFSNVPVFEHADVLENRHFWYFPLPGGKGVGGWVFSLARAFPLAVWP